MKKVGALVAAAGLIMGAIAGCSSGGGSSADEGAAITLESAAGTWLLESGTGPEGEVAPEDGNPIELLIEEDGTFSGSSGCNSIMGGMTITDGKVTMGPVAQTQMFCEGPAMDIEAAYTAALNVIDGGFVADGKLTLTGPDASLLYKLKN